MPACERCWAEYHRRSIGGRERSGDVTYSQVVAERDAVGGCTPEEQCGDLHIVVGDACRCGKVVRALAEGESDD